MACSGEFLCTGDRVSVRCGSKCYVNAQHSHPGTAPTRPSPAETHASQRGQKKYRGHQPARRTHDPSLKTKSSGACDLVGRKCTTREHNPNDPSTSPEFRRLAVAPCRKLR